MLSRVTLEDMIRLSSFIDTEVYNLLDPSALIMFDEDPPPKDEPEKIGSELLWAMQPGLSTPDEEVDLIKQLQVWMRNASEQS